MNVGPVRSVRPLRGYPHTYELLTHVGACRDELPLVADQPLRCAAVRPAQRCSLLHDPAKDGPQVARVSTDQAEYLAGRRLQRQRFA